MALAKSALAVLAATLVSAAWAQQGPMSEEIAWRLVELGPVVDLPNTAEIYAPLQEKEPYQGVRIATSNTVLRIAICSMSSCRRRRHRHARC
jgi:hypothetical protein